MEILRHIENRSLSIPRPILTMGNFDGIHLGHQAVLRRVIQDAKDSGGRSVVLTFEPHPLKILAPERAPRLILTHKDKLALLRSVGVDVVIIQDFNAGFADLEAREFVQRYLVDRIKVHRIWVGREFRFGKARKGGVEDLTRWGAEAGFEVRVMEPVEDQGLRVSSTRIREIIERPLGQPAACSFLALGSASGFPPVTDVAVVRRGASAAPLRPRPDSEGYFKKNS